MNIYANVLDKILASQIQQYIKSIIHLIKWNLFQGCKNGSIAIKSINVIYHINKTYKYMIISIGSGKAFNKIEHPFTIKAPNKASIEGTHFNKIKAIYASPQPVSYSMVKT